jgi:hypothetical protein
MSDEFGESLLQLFFNHGDSNSVIGCCVFKIPDGFVVGFNEAMQEEYDNGEQERDGCTEKVNSLFHANLNHFMLHRLRD